MLIQRLIQPKIEKKLFKEKIIIIYGARQVGKTTLIRQIQNKYQEGSIYFNCDEPDVRARLTNTTSTALKNFIGSKKLVFIDEAQRVENIGITLKLMVDNFPETQIVATGSSSFELSNKIMEPLTGRKYEFMLFPLATKELAQTHDATELKRTLEQRIIYGMYPSAVQNAADAALIVKNLATSYSYKDVLNFQGIRNPELLEKLLSALALQIGNEVSYNELGQLIGANRVTVQNYIRILEQAFIIFTLRPFHRNPRKELGKLHKIYFYDTGIRNALINNFNPIALRSDKGELWKNFWISERIKNNSIAESMANTYFWRTYSKKEIDYIEEQGGALYAFECKWKLPTKTLAPNEWTALYGQTPYHIETPENFIDSMFI